MTNEEINNLRVAHSKHHISQRGGVNTWVDIPTEHRSIYVTRYGWRSTVRRAYSDVHLSGVFTVELNGVKLPVEFDSETKAQKYVETVVALKGARP